MKTIQSFQYFKGFARLLLLLAAQQCMNSSAWADITECSSLKPSFSYATGKVCLPVVEIPSTTGSRFYKVQLKSLPDPNAIRFTLDAFTEVAPSGSNNPVYSTANGVLTIPAIEQYDLFGTNRYVVSLQLQPSSTETVFQLLPGIASIISPDYVVGKNWKPYVALEPFEKNALNLIGISSAYTNLATAIYNFDLKSVDAWDLKETISTDSGMQAGIYVNRDNNAVVLSFRGTSDDEGCKILSLFSCVLLDTRTGLLLTQGYDSGQFDDAYQFAGKMMNAYAPRKIVVTGHSLGGGLAQVVGASYGLETYAFNSSPVPNNFFDAHKVKQFDPRYVEFIHILADIHDPISNFRFSGRIYADASHAVEPIFFNFGTKTLAATNNNVEFDDFRVNKHSMEVLRDNIAATVSIYKGGW